MNFSTIVTLLEDYIPAEKIKLYAKAFKLSMEIHDKSWEGGAGYTISKAEAVSRVGTELGLSNNEQDFMIECLRYKWNMVNDWVASHK
ncbi:MAG: hypothetical protein EOL88_08105 [Bacteroidia bacterium]|nr:hypothetical protein [Bacteroidia bacterium]